MVKPDAVKKLGSIIERIQAAGFLIGQASHDMNFQESQTVQSLHRCTNVNVFGVKCLLHFCAVIVFQNMWSCKDRSPRQGSWCYRELCMCKLIREEAESFYQIHRCQPFFQKLIDFMTSDRIVALELLAPGICPCRVLKREELMSWRLHAACLPLWAVPRTIKLSQCLRHSGVRQNMSESSFCRSNCEMERSPRTDRFWACQIVSAKQHPSMLWNRQNSECLPWNWQSCNSPARMHLLFPWEGACVYSDCMYKRSLASFCSFKKETMREERHNFPSLCCMASRRQEAPWLLFDQNSRCTQQCRWQDLPFRLGGVGEEQMLRCV